MSSASPKRTILVFPLSGVGHVNSCAASTRPLLARGHRVIFALERSFAGKLAPLGFEEYIYTQKLELEQPGDGQPGDSNPGKAKPGEDWAKIFLQTGIIGPATSEEKMHLIIDLFIKAPSARSLIGQLDAALKEAITLYKPHLLWLDATYLLPGARASGIPWVLNMSNAYLVHCDDDHLPPGASGYAFDAVKDEAWYRFKALMRDQFLRSKEFNDTVESLGYARYPDDLILPLEESLLIVFASPAELVLPGISTKGWFNLEAFNKNEAKETISLVDLLPADFLTDNLSGTWSGKWVYVSLGSMGSVDVELMSRLMDVLGQSKHKFIVSKGPRHGEYSLPPNAWGDRFLPQTALLPQMDAVVTHGGNNTVTETFAQGVPMLLLPLFGDQYDNAARLAESGLGRRVDPYPSFRQEDLIESLDALLYDESLKERLRRAAERIQASGRHEELALKIEQLLAAKSNA